MAQQGHGAGIPSRAHGSECFGKPVDGSDLEEGLVWLNKQTAGLLFTMAISVCVHVCACMCVIPSCPPLQTSLTWPGEGFFRVTLSASYADVHLINISDKTVPLNWNSHSFVLLLNWEWGHGGKPQATFEVHIQIHHEALWGGTELSSSWCPMPCTQDSCPARLWLPHPGCVNKLLFEFQKARIET